MIEHGRFVVICIVDAEDDRLLTNVPSTAGVWIQLVVRDYFRGPSILVVPNIEGIA